MLKAAHNFNCECKACNDKLGPENLQVTAPIVSTLLSEGDQICKNIWQNPKIKPAIDQLKRNNHFINENHGNLRSKDVPAVVELNYRIIHTIAAKASRPFDYSNFNSSSDLE